jgi:4-hydroxy-4-methyl-2-oxoglutarate aldolase
MSLPHDYQNIAKVLGSSTLYEASGLPCAVDREIRAVWKGAFIAAPAYPLQCSPGDNLGLHLAVAKAPRGSVLVCDCADFIAGYWGEVLTVAAEAAGIVGFVINGGVRDIAALEAHGFPVFARGISVKGGLRRIMRQGCWVMLGLQQKLLCGQRKLNASLAWMLRGH